MELKPGYKQTEVGVIPEDWEPVVFGSLYSAPSKNGIYKSSEFQGRGTRIVNMGEMFGFEFISDQEMSRVELSPRELATNGLNDGDLLFGRRSVVPAGAGKCSLVISPPEPLTFESSIIRVRPDKDAAHPLYLYYFFASPTGKSVVSTIVAGTNVKGIRASELRELSVPKPTLAEQEAIAEALSDADALIDSLEQLIAKKRHLKQGAMQDLLTGKKRLPGFEGEWEVKTLGELATLWKGGINPATYPDKQFVHFSLPAFDEGAVPITELGASIGSNKFTVPTGAILVSKLNPRIPRIWAPSEIPAEAVCSTEFLVLVSNAAVDRAFLAALCASPIVSGQLKLHAIGTTGSHQRIHPSQALAVEASIPCNLPEQTAIAAILSDMDAEIAALEAKLAKARQVKQGMMQELLTGKTRLV